MVKKMKCTICGCTDEKTCPGGCSWHTTKPPVCSKCVLKTLDTGTFYWVWDDLIEIKVPNCDSRKEAQETLGMFLGSPVKTFHPYHYGGRQRKLTCLWGEFNFPERKVDACPGKTNSTGNVGRGGDYRRAVTPEEFANAFFEVNQ